MKVAGLFLVAIGGVAAFGGMPAPDAFVELDLWEPEFERSAPCEPDVHCLYDGFEPAGDNMTLHKLLHQQSLQNLDALEKVLAEQYPEGLARLEAHFEDQGITGDERWRDIQKHIANDDAGGWTRRLLESDPYEDQKMARGGSTPELYGGGGGGGPPQCPYGSIWGGAGDYCMNSHIYKCSCAGCPPQYKVTDCRGYGCKQNPPGMQDTCITGSSNGQCNNDAHCPDWFVCSRGQCVPYNGGGGGGGNVRCSSNSQCFGTQWCNNGWCQASGGGSGSCSNNIPCPYGQYCNNGWCTSSGGGGGSCSSNSQCPSNQYCLNGWCTSSGGGSGSCSNNIPCPYGQYCNNGWCTSSGGTNGSPLSQFQNPQYDYAVKGQNDDIIDRVYSASDCADRCLRATRFYCASFEYAPAGNRCVLSSGVYPVIYASGWNLQIRY